MEGGLDCHFFFPNPNDKGGSIPYYHIPRSDDWMLYNVICFLFTGVLVQHGIKVTCEKTGNFKSTLQKSYRSVAFLLNNSKLPNDEVCLINLENIISERSNLHILTLVLII